MRLEQKGHADMRSYLTKYLWVTVQNGLAMDTGT